jgi:hypothetical protein
LKRITWHAYWRWRREEAEEATATKRAAMASARKEAMSQPSQSCVFIDLGYDGPLTSGGDEGMTPRSSILAYLVPTKEEARSKVTQSPQGSELRLGVEGKNYL